MNELAVFGGTPVRTKKWGDWPIISQDEIDCVNSVFQSNVFTGFRAGNYDGGTNVVNFEQDVCKETGSKFAVSFDTWSNGLYAILLALGVKPGDEVILPGYTMTACASMVLACGAVPIFVDTEPEKCWMSTELVKKAVTDRTVAVMVVHLFGFPSSMKDLSDFCTEKDIWLIEDCAQSPLSYLDGQRCGLIGDVGGFSFTQNKLVMSGEGGCAITNDPKINNALRYIRNHGEVSTFPEIRNKFDMYYTNIPGFNFRMTEMSAALARSNYKKLNSEVEHRRNLARYLNDELKDINGIKTFLPDLVDCSSYFLYPVLYKGRSKKSDVCHALRLEGINVLDGYCKPIYRQTLYSTDPAWSIMAHSDLNKYKPEYFPNTECLQYKELMIFQDVRNPHDINDMKDIVDAIKKVINFYR